jgi:DNA polymerase-3 subunit epsilon
MNLKLTKPIVFFDLETTGVDVVRDRIVQIAMIKIHPDGERETLSELVDPQMSIPAESTAIHGITDDDVVGKPTFRDLAENILAFVGDADLGGYNLIRFDIPVLAEEFIRVGTTFDTQGRHIVDVYQIFSLRESRTLSKAMEFYCGKEMVDAHDTAADIAATAEVLEGQLAMYTDLDGTVEELDRQYIPRHLRNTVDPEGKLRWEKGEVVLGFGSRRGELLRDLAKDNPNYLKWMLNANFNLTVQQIVRDALKGHFPKPPQG